MINIKIPSNSLQFFSNLIRIRLEKIMPNLIRICFVLDWILINKIKWKRWWVFNSSTTIVGKWGFQKLGNPRGKQQAKKLSFYKGKNIFFFYIRGSLQFPPDIWNQLISILFFSKISKYPNFVIPSIKFNKIFWFREYSIVQNSTCPQLNIKVAQSQIQFGWT